MKVYKTKPDEYGWYLVVHKRKDNSLHLMTKQIEGKHKENWSDIWIYTKEELKLLKEVLKEKKQGDEE